MPHFQTSLAEIGLLPGKATRRAEFFGWLDRPVPWGRWAAVVEPHRPQAGCHRDHAQGARRAEGAQHFRGGVRGPAQRSRALSTFLGAAKVPDKTTLCKSRRMMVSGGLGREIFEGLAARLEAEGLTMREGPVVDASFVESPSSAKNRDHARDPEEHQAGRGSNWYFWYKAHIGADRDSGLAHTVVTTAANVANVTMAKDCVREGDSELYLDAGYTGLGKGPEAAGEGGALFGKRPFVAARRSRVATDEDRFRERAISRVRSVVEHPFHYLKDVMRARRTRHRGGEGRTTRRPVCASRYPTS